MLLRGSVNLPGSLRPAWLTSSAYGDWHAVTLWHRRQHSTVHEPSCCTEHGFHTDHCSTVVNNCSGVIFSAGAMSINSGTKTNPSGSASGHARWE